MTGPKLSSSLATDIMHPNKLVLATLSKEESKASFITVILMHPNSTARKYLNTIALLPIFVDTAVELSE
jgi:hypothetical protein